jgi:hypothetical protein
MLAHPPSPNPTTKIHKTMNAFKTYTAVQLGRKKGGFSTAFCKMREETKLVFGQRFVKLFIYSI